MPDEMTAEELRAYWRSTGELVEPIPQHPRPNKYGAVRTEVDGITFASKAEARRYQDLRLMEKEGLIENLELQPRFQLVVNGYRIGRYTGDFSYVIAESQLRVVEDVKGATSRDYTLRKKLMRAIHGIEVTEIHG